MPKARLRVVCLALRVIRVSRVYLLKMEITRSLVHWRIKNLFNGREIQTLIRKQIVPIRFRKEGRSHVQEKKVTVLNSEASVLVVTPK